MSISESSKVDHQFYPSINEIYDDGMIISVILDCFHQLEYVKQSVTSVLKQDYNNVELMLIDNGASNDISKYLKEIHANHKNTSLIVYKENQFLWNDRDKSIRVCWNGGLKYCKGEIVSHLSYDDMFSKNYAGKMVKLFEDNPNCVTAGPLPVSIDSSGDLNKAMDDGGKDFLESNKRPTYIEGRKVALDFIQGSPKRMFGSPGEIFAIKKSLLLKYDGFEQGIDILQILKYAIHGDIGFDPEAYVYWRRHDSQMNVMLEKKGHINVRDFKRMIKRSNIINIWKSHFSLSEVKLLEVYIKNQIRKNPLFMSRSMIANKNLYGLLLVFFHTARECPEMLFKTILHSISFSGRIVLHKLKLTNDPFKNKLK